MAGYCSPNGRFGQRVVKILGERMALEASYEEGGETNETRFVMSETVWREDMMSHDMQ